MNNFTLQHVQMWLQKNLAFLASGNPTKYALLFLKLDFSSMEINWYSQTATMSIRNIRGSVNILRNKVPGALFQKIHVLRHKSCKTSQPDVLASVHTDASSKQINLFKAVHGAPTDSVPDKPHQPFILSAKDAAPPFFFLLSCVLLSFSSSGPWEEGEPRYGNWWYTSKLKYAAVWTNDLTV